LTETRPQVLWRGFNINQENNTREAILEVLEERFRNFEGEISKAELADEIGVDPETVRRQAQKLKRQDKIEEVDRSDSTRAFYKLKSDEDRVSEDEELLNEIKRAHEEAKNILGGYLHPTLEGTAFVGNFDPESERFRRAFHHLVRKQQDWNIPSESKIEGWKSDLTKLIGFAAIEASEDVESSVPEVPGEDVYTPEEYAEKNREFIEKVEIKHKDGDFEMMRLPDKLAYFTEDHILFDADLGIDVTEYTIDESEMEQETENK
jgi:DNA-binding Lrp family transcriptional regulator